MKKVLFITNLPAPYRMDFFNQLGERCDLTVAFERRKALDRDPKWVGEQAQSFVALYPDLEPIGQSQSKGSGLVGLLKSQTYDIVIFGGYASPAVRLAIAHCKRKRIAYYIEYDGGFNKKDSFLKRIYQKFLLRRAKGHFVTCDELKAYLAGLGILEKKLHFYPFSSLRKEDILPAAPTTLQKKMWKQELGIQEECALLAVGQFIPRKGLDVLIRAAREVDPSCGIYLVGGEPTEEYIALKQELNIPHVHFQGFMGKNELQKWYRACDIFALTTREDIWGLVINEAMANGLPILSTQRCIAALELVKDGVNGYIVPVEDASALAEKINILVHNSELRISMAEQSLKKIQDYTIENMVEYHVKYLKFDEDGYPTKGD